MHDSSTRMRVPGLRRCRHVRLDGIRHPDPTTLGERDAAQDDSALRRGDQHRIRVPHRDPSAADGYDVARADRSPQSVLRDAAPAQSTHTRDTLSRDQLGDDVHRSIMAGSRHPLTAR
ncbi:hypothetical protein [Microbacterium maritypicum]